MCNICFYAALPLLPVAVTFTVDHDFYIYLYKDESQSGL